MAPGDLSLHDRLQRIETEQKAQTKLMTQMRLDIVSLKVKASIWGAAAGLVATVILDRLLG